MFATVRHSNRVQRESERNKGYVVFALPIWGWWYVYVRSDTLRQWGNLCTLATGQQIHCQLHYTRTPPPHPSNVRRLIFHSAIMINWSLLSETTIRTSICIGLYCTFFYDRMDYLTLGNPNNC